MNSISYTLPSELAAAVSLELDDWQGNKKVSRLWARDASLWTNSDEAQWLDWLTIVEDSQGQLGELLTFAQDIRENKITHVVLLGMGGSSMGPEVLRETYGHIAGSPDFRVLDSTDPAQVKAVEEAVELAHTLFIVASKSGSTLEPNILKAYFYQRLIEVVGIDRAAEHFIAITDPGSSLEKEAGDDGFLKVFHGKPGIGGRFSVLSNFGLVPAAVMGIDVVRFIDATMKMVDSCKEQDIVQENPGVILGCILGASANAGRDKLTIIASPGLASIGAWLEQLVAESTGKQGKSVIPIDGESVGKPDVYGDDRVFVYLRLDESPGLERDRAVDLLEKAGHPVIRINVTDAYNLGQEFFRWEIATAVAGSVMGVNPFDQPDVEASKIETRKLTDAYETGDSFSEEVPLAADDMLALYADPHNAATLRETCGAGASVAGLLKAHLDRIVEGDYVAFLAYLERSETNTGLFRGMRDTLRDTRKIATCLGFGPRFLHSTGQAYKGGKNNGIFLQITCDAAEDLSVPGHSYTFGVVEAAQARGDFEVLAERRRRLLRIHIGKDVPGGLARLDELIAG
jgi:transaldolase/glucose-6-phosphate isomerase